MKIKLMSRAPSLAFLVVILIFNASFVSLAQQNSVRAKAIVAAERDAEARVNKSVWLLGACFSYGIVPLIIANVAEPVPPASALIGKSPEYVAFYTDAYKAKVRKIRTSGVKLGCALGVGCSVAYFLSVGVLSEIGE